MSTTKESKLHNSQIVDADNAERNIQKLHINEHDDQQQQQQQQQSDNHRSSSSSSSAIQQIGSSSSSSSNGGNSSNKEEIRRRLAFDEIDDDDDPIAQYKLNRKSQKASTLSARIQNLDSLQICFLNENNENYTFGDLNHMGNETNNNDIIMQNRIYYLFKKLQKVNFDLDKVDLFGDIEKPSDQTKFSEYHSKLYTEAKLTLSQVCIFIEQQQQQKKIQINFVLFINTR